MSESSHVAGTSKDPLEAAGLDPQGAFDRVFAREGYVEGLADLHPVGIVRALARHLVAARSSISDVTRERDEAMEEFRYQSTEHGKALHALGSLQELLAKQIAVPKSSGALACAACGWPNDKHPDDCPVKRGLEIIERALGEADLATGLNAAKSEVRLNDDGTLDEVCAPDAHMEQMDNTCWFIEIGDVAVWLSSKAKIKANYERRNRHSSCSSQGDKA